MIRLAVRCRPEHAERVLSELVELVPDGVEEERSDTYVEYAIYGPPGELPELPDLRAAAGEGLVDIETTEVPDDWADSWRDFHRPILVGDRLLVRPSWIESDRQPTVHEVVIDPGRAFGTGAHHTTRMCLELLLELSGIGKATGALSDWGTGSGVLAISAAKLGFDPVLACDSEPASIQAAQVNAKLNGVELELRRVNLRDRPPPAAQTATANLTAPILRAVAQTLESPPHTLVCSGLLTSEADAIGRAFEPHGLREQRRLQGGEWAALLLTADGG